MKKTILEKSFVILLFALVMVAFAFAERDTQKLFEKCNKKNTVETPRPTVDYTADIPEKPTNKNKTTRN